MPDRRRVSLFLAAWPLLASSAEQGQALAQHLRAGRCAVLMRHAQTEPGVGDPPEFDLADSESSCPVRFTTTVPTQSLTMLNGEFFVREAERFAARLAAEVGDDPADQVERALWLTWCRPPTATELDRGVRLMENLQHEDGMTAQGALKYFCLLALNLNEFVYLD